jgi:hypothetical protein
MFFNTILFASTLIHDGNRGGRDDTNAFCMEQQLYVDLQCESAKMFISYSNDDDIYHFSPVNTSAPVVGPYNTLVAQNWTGLLTFICL